MNQSDQRQEQWFIFKGEQHRGPYQTDEMVNLFTLGVIGHKDLVWREGGGSWLPFCEHDIFREIIFKDVSASSKPVLEEKPPLHVDRSKVETAATIIEVEEAPPPLPPMPDDVDEQLDQVEISIDQEVSEFDEDTSPTLPKFQLSTEESEEDEENEEEDFEEGEVSRFPWGKILSGVAAVLALVITGLWLFKFQLQSYDLIGLEQPSVDRFNDVVLDAEKDHAIEFTKDGNVIWAAIPNVIEGEAYLKVKSIPGRVLATDELEVVSQANFVQGLVPFKRFSFNRGERWVPGEYQYELMLRPRGTVSRLASFLSPYPVVGSWSWVKNHSRGHSFKGKIARYNGSANQFAKDLEQFKGQIWDSLSKPIQNRLEKYQTLKKLALSTRELWYQRLSVAVTWRAFKKYDEGYGRDIAPVLQALVIDSIKTAQAAQEKSPLIARLFQEIEETGKQLGELASIMSEVSKSVKQYKPQDKTRVTQKFEELWGPLISKIDSRIQSLETEYSELKKSYNVIE